MAQQLEKFIRVFKKYYEEIGNQIPAGKIGIDQYLFGSDDIDSDSSNFVLDEFIDNPPAAPYRRDDAGSHMLPYKAGTGQVYAVPSSSLSTPIPRSLRNAVVEGVEATAGISSNDLARMAKIMKMHTASHVATRWKTSLDTMRTGKFTPLGLDGKDIGMGIDYGRNPDLTIPYDFTAGGASINKAIAEGLIAYRGAGGSTSNVSMILGRKFMDLLSADEDFKRYMQNNSSNLILQTTGLMDQMIAKTVGLYHHCRYMIPGFAFNVNILTYEPKFKYVLKKGDAPVDFFPDDEALIFDADDIRWRVMRNIQVMTGPGTIADVAGEIAFDYDILTNPIKEIVRSHACIAYVPGNVDRIAQIIGTFAP